ncbi:hypothetical protein [Nostoc sp.]|uniref:hypothetical protein n=1 Tax=Nostoc sp. TaxID=1180 RepID=UPI002FF583FB
MSLLAVTGKTLVPQGGSQKSLIQKSKEIQRKRFIDLKWVVYFRRAVLVLQGVNLLTISIHKTWGKIPLLKVGKLLAQFTSTTSL